MAKKLPIVEVEWVDSLRKGGWRDLKDYINETVTPMCRSAGYLLQSNRKQVTLVQSFDDNNGSATDSISIPRCCIKSIKRLEVKSDGK